MVARKELSWEDVADPAFASPARKAWREAVADVAEKAKAALPASKGRIDAAVKLVLAGDVERLDDGTARVASQSNGTTIYHLVNDHCDCADYAKAFEGWCKHRLAAAIQRRATAKAKALLHQLDHATAQPEAPTPEPPATAPEPPPPGVPALL